MHAAYLLGFPLLDLKQTSEVRWSNGRLLPQTGTAVYKPCVNAYSMSAAKLRYIRRNQNCVTFFSSPKGLKEPEMIYAEVSTS